MVLAVRAQCKRPPERIVETASVSIGIMYAKCPLPCHAAPIITSVSQSSTQQVQTIVISGSGFGTQTAYTGDSFYIVFLENSKGVGPLASRVPAPPGLNGCGGISFINDAVGLIVYSWTGSSIVLGGFSGAWG